MAAMGYPFGGRFAPRRARCARRGFVTARRERQGFGLPFFCVHVRAEHFGGLSFQEASGMVRKDVERGW